MVPKMRKEVSLYFFSHFCPYGRNLVVRCQMARWSGVRWSGGQVSDGQVDRWLGTKLAQGEPAWARVVALAQLKAGLVLRVEELATGHSRYQGRILNYSFSPRGDHLDPRFPFHPHLTLSTF